MTKQNTVKPNPCEQYELAITNYVLGEKIDIPQTELFNHLAKCPSCQGDLRNWRATYATMRAKEYDARPEVKQKMGAFIKELVRQPIQPKPKSVQGKPVLDNETEIGTPAGAVWRYLAKNGWVKVNDLAKNLRRTDKIDPDETKFAVGWLLRENKAYYTKKKQDIYVYLAEHEREIYQKQAGQAQM